MLPPAAGSASRLHQIHGRAHGSYWRSADLEASACECLLLKLEHSLVKAGFCQGHIEYFEEPRLHGLAHIPAKWTPVRR